MGDVEEAVEPDLDHLETILAEAVLCLLEKNGRYLLAISGGVDSMALLHCCASLQERCGFVFHVLHIDHGFRPESKSEALFVEKAAKSYNLPVSLISLPALPRGENLENWARNERYKCYHQSLEEHGLSFVVTAHHQDDLVETFLMRILSNKEPRALLEENEALRVLRPFLSLSKHQLREYTRLKGVSSIEDESNNDLMFLRNRVRHCLVPFLREHFGEAVIPNLTSQALSLEQELKALQVLAEREIQALLQCDFGSREWLNALRKVLLESPIAFSRKIVRKLFLPFTGAPLGRASSQRLVEFFLKGDVALQLPGGIEVRRKGGGIVVRRAPGNASEGLGGHFS